MDKLKYWLRWIAILPISILAGTLVTIPLHFILYKTLSGGKNPFISPYPELPERILSPFFIAFTVVWVASFIAPRYKFKVSMIVAIIWVFASGGVLAMGFFEVHTDSISYSLIGGGIPVFMGVIGSFVGAFQVKKKQEGSDIYEYDWE